MTDKIRVTTYPCGNTQTITKKYIVEVGTFENRRYIKSIITAQGFNNAVAIYEVKNSIDQLKVMLSDMEDITWT